MTIQPLVTQASTDWLRLRLALWPDASARLGFQETERVIYFNMAPGMRREHR